MATAGFNQLVMIQLKLRVLINEEEWESGQDIRRQHVGT